VAQLLRMFDLGVPVRAFNETHRNPVPAFARERFEKAKYIGRATLIGLHRQPKPVVPDQVACA